MRRIGGNVPRDEAVSLLAELTSGWEPASEAAEPRELASRDGSGNLETIDVDTLEGWVAIGRGLGPVPADERAPLAVLGEVLGTRLNISVREIRGLANRATFFLPETTNGAGLLHIRTGGRPEAVAPLIKYCREEMAALHRNERPVTEEELALAKGILRLGKWQESLDGARRAAAAYALATLYDGDTGRLLSWPEDVEAVSADQVEAVAKKISTRGPWTLSSSAPSSGSARHGIRAGRRIWMRCRPPEMITHWSSARWPVLFAVATLGVTSLCAARASSVKKVAAVTLLVATTATAQELSTVPVQELVLRNGFRLLVVEVPGAPRWRLVSGRRDR